METLQVISNKKRQWIKRVQWLRNVHDTPKNNLSSTAADTFGTPIISNSVSKWIRSFCIFDFVAGDNPSQLFELCPLFQLTRVTFDPALPYKALQVWITSLAMLYFHWAWFSGCIPYCVSFPVHMLRHRRAVAQCVGSKHFHKYLFNVVATSI